MLKTSQGKQPFSSISTQKWGDLIFTSNSLITSHNHHSIYWQRTPLINKSWYTRMMDTWLASPVYLYLQNTGKVCRGSRAWGVWGFYNNFKLVSKLVSNRTHCSPAVLFMWIHPVENSTIKTYPKFWLGYGSVGTAQAPRLPLDWGPIKPQWSTENYSMFQRKVFENFGIKLIIALTFPSFGEKLLFTTHIQCTA